MKYLSHIVIVVVLIVIVTGFWLIGSPMQERLRKFDERRVNDLQSLQGEVMNYWRNKSELPKNLVSLNDDIRDFRIPKDPMTGQDYEYAVIASERFSLCASFALQSDVSKNNNSSWSMAPWVTTMEIKPSSHDGYVSEAWGHGGGRVCFDRPFDKELYRPYPTVPTKGI
ncbi:MAG: hypothetical protein HZA35_03895 [Parcubacteria group bacterium]|nr:hypothetical protein [Parcubacteria group bacterium]